MVLDATLAEESFELENDTNRFDAVGGRLMYYGMVH